MTIDELSVNQQVNWHYVCSNYGHVTVIPVIVRKIGKARVTVEAPLRNGGTKLTSVRPKNLRPLRLRDPERRER